MTDEGWMHWPRDSQEERFSVVQRLGIDTVNISALPPRRPHRAGIDWNRCLKGTQIKALGLWHCKSGQANTKREKYFFFFFEEFSLLEVWSCDGDGQTEGLFQISIPRTYEGSSWQMLSGWYYAPSSDFFFSLSMLQQLHLYISLSGDSHSMPSLQKKRKRLIF